MRTRWQKDKLDCVTNATFIHCNDKARGVWIARITGPDEKYYLAREFLTPIGYAGGYGSGLKQYDLSELEPCILEVSGGSWKNKYYCYLVVGRKYIAAITRVGSLPRDARTRKRIIRLAEKFQARMAKAAIV